MIVALQNARIAQYIFIVSTPIFFVFCSLLYSILNTLKADKSKGGLTCDEADGNLLRTCMRDEAESCATGMSIKQEDDGPIVIGLDARLIRFCNELHLDPINK
jgi:hypothetical protein